MFGEDRREENHCVDLLFEVLQSGLSSQQVQVLRAEAEAELRNIAKTAGMPLDAVLRLTSAWGYSQPWIQRTVNRLEPTIKGALARTKGKTRISVSKLIDATLFVQNGLYDNKTHAHQDISYKWNKDIQSRYAWTTWLALDACDDESGALRFSSGYPRRPIATRVDHLNSGFKDLAETEKWRAGESIARLMAGDMVVFDSQAWHSSRTEKGGGIRMAIAMRWKSVDGWEEGVELSEAKIKRDEFGMDNSGALLIDAICRFQILEGIKMLSGMCTTHQVVDQFLSGSPSLLNKLKPESRVVLAELSNALELSHNYHARVSAGVWRDVRDIVLPDFRRLIVSAS